MSVRDKIESEVAQLTLDRGYAGPEWGFGFWFIERVEDFSEEEAERIVIDGAWDGGRDAVDFDEDTATLTIWQFKWSDHDRYVQNALSDIQRALPLEEQNLARAERLKLKVVSKFKAGVDFLAEVKRVRTWIRTWVRRRYPDIAKENIEVEVYDIMFFTQLYEELFGVSGALTFNAPPLVLGDALLGLIDLHGLKDHVDDEALFAFNIRKFLGLRKGSVNVEIRETLKDDDERSAFWMLNNGIVCLCTEFDVPPGGVAGTFDNLTIVNGAQTVTTGVNFLLQNQTIEDPVWCVAKIMKVAPADLDRARQLTKTSNRQSAASSTDLRSVDIAHPRIASWMKAYRDLDYSYRRGLGGPRGGAVVPMKAMSQAFIAFWTDEPNVPFANVGALFSADKYYGLVFPEAEIDRLNEIDEAGIPTFLDQRVIPWLILRGVRAHIKARIAAGDADRKWRSAAYHLTWLYRVLLEEVGAEPLVIAGREEEFIEATVADLFDALTDFAQRHDIPKDLKSDKLVKELQGGALFGLTAGRRAKSAAAELLDA